MQLRRNHSGFTLVELAIVVSIMGMLLGAVSVFHLRCQDSFEQSRAQSRADGAARQAAARILEELSGVSPTMFVPDPTSAFGGDTLTFQRPLSVSNVGVVAWSTQTRLALLMDDGENDNGLDDDGDGLIDEGQVIFTRNVGQVDENSTTLVRGVSEYLEGETGNVGDENANGFNDEQGFCMTLQGSLMLLRITLERPVKEGRTVLASVETAVRLKN